MQAQTTNNKQIAELTRYIEVNMKSIKSFRSQLAFAEVRIRNGEERLPQIKREIAAIEKGLPIWRDDARVYKLSLATHRKNLAKELHKFELLKKKRKILAQLKKLDK